MATPIAPWMVVVVVVVMMDGNQVESLLRPGD